MHGNPVKYEIGKKLKSAQLIKNGFGKWQQLSPGDLQVTDLMMKHH